MDESLRETFLGATREALTALETELVALEDLGGGQGDPDRIRRLLHTVKGNCSMFGLARAAAVAHGLEDLFPAGRTPGGEAIQLAFEGADILRALVERGGAEEDVDAAFVADYFERLKRAEAKVAPACGGDASAAREALAEAATAARALREDLDGFGDFASLEEALQRAQDALQEAESVSTPGAQSSSEGASAPPVEAPAETNGAPAKGHAAAERTVRIAQGQLDRMLDEVGELIEATEVARHLRRRLDATTVPPELLREFRGFSGTLDERVLALHGELLGLRRVRLEAALANLPRMARDLARDLGKEVALTVEDGGASVDKSLLDEVEACVVQLVRNAVAHGIESPAARETAGKPRRGTISVCAREEDRSILVEVSDDGGGLPLESIRRRAVELGVAPNAATLTDRDVGQLIFSSGLSTAGGVDLASGRGVGLDVVAAETRRMGGSAGVETAEGRGTTVTLRLPVDVTLSVVQGLLARAGTVRFVLPAEAVEESLHPRAEMLGTVRGGECETLFVHGDVLPLHRVNQLFGIEPNGRAGEPVAILLREGDRRAAFLFDEVLELQQAVVKPIPGLPLLEAVSGGAVLGDGRVGLVLDPAGLFETAERR